MTIPHDHLAKLTEQRDREVADVSLARALQELLGASTVAVYRTVGDPGDLRWFNRASVRRGNPVATFDAPWEGTAHLPCLDAMAQHRAALTGRAVLSIGRDESINVFPIETELETVGVVEVVTKTPLDDRALATIASVLRFFRNFQNLLDYSERDTLTGLLNRKTFDEGFFKMFQGASWAPSQEAGRRMGTSASDFWLAMVDIDHFKSVNDVHGHLIGDEVLLVLSRLMRGTLRFQDRLYRFGGEEFVFLLPCESEGDAAAVMERMRRATESHVFPQVGHITISVGYTRILSTDSPSSALERADRGVYRAKAEGRNRVCGQGPLERDGANGAEKMGEIELF